MSSGNECLIRPHRMSWIVLHLLVFLMGFTSTYAYEVFSSQPRLRVQRGSLFIESSGNVSIKARSFNVNGEEISKFIATLTRLAPRLETLQRLTGGAEDSDPQDSVQINALAQRLRRLEQVLAQNHSVPLSGVDISRSQYDQLNSFSRRITLLARRVTRMERLLTRNECASNPCQHGATCEDSYNAFFCRCPPGWEGSHCDVDVNECYRFAGSDLGCQNGATCTNTLGSYRCQCKDGWFGLHCTQSSDSCAAGNLCGNGVCIDDSNHKHVCICNQGWKNDPQTRACTLDVDECSDNKPPCSHDPVVPCINTPGSYVCGSCPPGYTGNGYFCMDVDECLIDNGGCSMNPKVQCVNTRGSSVCGSCPPGYQGDGRSCFFQGLCQVNNGGCHPMATCISGAGLGQSVMCECRAGWTGNGVGPAGCTALPAAQATACSSTPCRHGGTCVPSPQRPRGFQCLCPNTYFGDMCESSNPCGPVNPCQNGATCVPGPGNTGYYCDCPDNFSGDRCEIPQEACGGFLRSEAGTLRFPHANSSIQYPNGVNCGWVITTNRTLVLRVNFIRFNLEKSPLCSYDWLQIHDGSTSESYQIGRFCGDKLPKNGTIVSTHNSLYLWFRSDSNIASEGFELHWTSIMPECGGRIVMQSHASISSPGSPGKYPANRDCWWVVSAPPGRRVQLHFFSLQIEAHPNCSFDYLEVLDGRETTSPLLARYCNTTHPPPLVGSGSGVVLHFHSDQLGQDMGFQIAASAVEGIPGCGGIITTPSGEIRSPMEPDSLNYYRDNLDCVWKIQMPANERINLEFISFDLESQTHHCGFDYLEVRDGPTSDSPLVGRYCGADLPPRFSSSGNQLYIHFHTDSSFSRPGFVLRHRLVCGGIFTSLSGTIYSPYYPNQYPKERTCVYEIQLPSGKAVALEFADFSVEDNSFEGQCFNDYVAVRDGDSVNSTLIGKYCGEKGDLPDHPLMSTHNFMYIEFHTDATVSSRGFKANYSSIDILCGGILKERTGVVESPRSSDGRHPSNSQCTWLIVAPPGFVVQLTFVSFVLEKSRDCDFDYVAVYDNSTLSTGGLVGKYCGRSLPPVLTSTDSIMTVVFHSDKSVNFEGFMATYAHLNQTHACGGKYYSSSGVLRSPGYPNNYPPGRDCEYVIQIPNGYRIRINFTDLDMESYRDCSWDYVEIRNGGSNKSPVVGKFCGTSPPPSFLTATNEVYLRFHSDPNISGRGFRLEWDGATQGCGGMLSSPTGVIASPNYPQPYGRSSECFWSVGASKGSVIRAVFLDLDLEFHTNCKFDYVELWDGAPGVGTQMGRYCNSKPDPVTTKSNHLYVKFHSDLLFNGRGFQLDYEARCNTNLTGFRGVIESPNFPNTPPSGANCTWVITVPEGNLINMTFSHLDLVPPPFPFSRFRWRNLRSSIVMPGTPNQIRWTPFMNDYSQIPYLRRLQSTALAKCSFASVSVKDIGRDPYPPAGTTPDLGRFCGTTVPPMISSQSNSVSIAFMSSSVKGTGFRIEWVVNGCGGELRRPSGQFTSPNYPNMYPHNLICEWKIIADWGNSLELTVSDFSLEQVSSCSFDSLTVFGGPDDTAPVLTQLCHTQKDSVVVTSSSRYMFVRFISDSSYNGHGFKAEYEASPRGNGCGGLFTAPQGRIHSKNYPFLYDVNDDCVWQIRVAENHVIKLDILHLDIYTDDNCVSDYLKVFDGDGMDKPVLLSSCSGYGNDSLTSTSNVVTMRMKSDGRRASSGFSAEYSTSCGARIVTNGSGIVSSLDSINMGLRNQNCSWIIMAQDLSKRVTLTITYLAISQRLELDSDCGPTSNFVEVRDGTDSDGPLLGSFCGRTVPLPVTSRGAALFVQLVSPSNTFHGWFSAAYSVLDTACGGTFTAERGSFASPGYPESYPVSAECVWNISASAGNKVQISFRSFSLEDSPSCNDDFLEVRKESAMGDLIGVFCGDSIPSNLTAAHSLWVKFRSNGVGTGPGFLADFVLVHSNLDLTGPSGQLASPMYPRPFPQEGEFHWRIMVSSGKRIAIRFIDFSMDMFVECDETYLEIFDGFDDTMPKIFKGCGSTLPDPVTSSMNVVYIKFVSMPYRWGAKFLLDWLEVGAPPKSQSVEISDSKKGCGFEVFISPGTSFNLSSVGYPDGYGQCDCSWIISTTPGWHLSIEFEVLDLEQSPQCSNDYITIFSGEGGTQDWKAERKLCVHNDSVIHTSNLMKVNFYADYYLNGTGFLATIHSVCGGELSGPTGFLESSNSSNLKGPTIMLGCEWKVKVRPGRTITVTITEMDMHTDKKSPFGCDFAFLLLKNGGSSDSPLLGQGQYCGSTIPQDSISTSSNQLFVKFRPDLKGSRFRLRYEETSPNCGQDVHLSADYPFRVVSSPRYPNIPPPYSECIWRVSVPPAERVAVDFIGRFDLTRDPDCRHNALELRDGATATSELVGRFCMSKPASQATTGNMLYMRYFTDESEPRNGFSANVSIATCGGTLRGQSGVISSPGYPSSLPLNTECVWKLEAIPPSRTLTLSFLEMSLPPHRTCAIASVTISGQGTGVIEQNSTQTADETVLGKFCGTKLPSNVTSFSSQVTVTFKSSNLSASPYLTHHGFALRFSVNLNSECGGTLETPTGVIRSPGYPGHVPRLRCTWRIRGPVGRRVRLTVQEIDLSSGETSYGTLAQRIFLFQGAEEIMMMAYINYTTAAGSVFESSSNSMTIVLFSLTATNNKGFRFSYSTELPEMCGGLLPVEMVAPLQPPGNATISFLCRWRFDIRGFNVTAVNVSASDAGTSGRTLAVTIAELDMHSKPRYPCSKYMSRILLERFDGTGIGVACNTITSPLTIRSPFSDVLLTVAKSGLHRSPKMDFLISYHWSDCGGVIYGPQELVLSGRSDREMDCAWRADFDEGVHVEVVVESFGKEAATCDAFVTIYNGDSTASPNMGRFCSTQSSETVHVTASSLWIEFHAPASAVGRLFRVRLSLLSQACGGVLHGDKGVLTSPGFPREYPPNTECEWEIRVPRGNRVELRFVERFNLQLKDKCEADYVQVSDQVAGEWRQLGRWCGRNPPSSLLSSAERLRVLFHSDATVSTEGFKASWITKCGFDMIITGPGEVVSPGYPGGYGPNLNCNYTLRAPGKVITAEFLDISVEFSRLCQYDNITVYRSYADDPSVLWQGSDEARPAVYCDAKKPPPFRTRNKFHWTFQSDSFWQSNGFRLKYSLDQCNENITEASEIRSPGGSTYSEMANCTWKIIAPEGHVVRLRFSQFEVEQNFECFNDYLEVYDGLTANDSALLGRFCGDLSDNLPSVHANGRYMLVHWKTDNTISHGGFRAKVWFTRTVCGTGSLNFTLAPGATSSFSSTNIGPFEDCQWVVVTVPGYNVELTVKTLNIGTCSGTNSSRDCHCDFLEVRDGPGQFSELIGRFCGSVPPPKITSSDRSLWVRLRSDGQLARGALLASLRSVASLCGASQLSFTNNTRIIVKSPGYPAPPPPNVFCRWELQVWGNRLKVAFDELKLGGRSPCTDRDNSVTALRDGRLDVVKVVAYRSTSYKYILGKDIYPKDSAGMTAYESSDTKMSYCGSSLPPPFYIADYASSVVINYHSGESSPGRFQLQILQLKDLCAMNLTDPSDRIVFSSEQTICVVKILAPSPNETISLYFSEFSSQNCPSSGLEIRDGSESSSPLLGRFCGQNPVSGISSTGPSMLLKFWTPQESYAIVDAFYVTTQQGRGCGGYIRQYSGVFTSPMYPGNFRNNSVCRWDIEVHGSAELAVWFSVFDMGPKTTCGTDFVEFYDVDHNNNDIKKAQYCGGDKPALYRASTQRVAVKYTTSVHNGGLGWVIRFLALGPGERGPPSHLLPVY